MEEDTGRPMLIAYDTVLDQPACVNLQAVLGGSSEAAMAFPSAAWLVAPTPDMRVYSLTEAQLDFLVERARKRFGIA